MEYMKGSKLRKPLLFLPDMLKDKKDAVSVKFLYNGMIIHIVLAVGTS
jgi:hypothetical protein